MLAKITDNLTQRELMFGLCLTMLLIALKVLVGGPADDPLSEIFIWGGIAAIGLGTIFEI